MESAGWLPATAGLMLRDVRLPDTKLTAAPGSASFRADHRLSVDDHRLSVDDHRLSVDDHRSFVDDHRSFVDAHRSSVGVHRSSVGVHRSFVDDHGKSRDAFQFTVNHHRNRI